MGKPQASFSKRQREQAKRDRQQQKKERRAQRASEPKSDIEGDDILTASELEELNNLPANAPV